MTTTKPEPLLWLSDARGQYIPRDFAASFLDRAKHVTGVSDDDWQTLENPDHEWYWEAWQNVCDNAVITDENGVRYHIHQDGDCWLIPEGMIWDDALEFFIWEQEEEKEEAT